MTAYVVDENVPVVANDSGRPTPKTPQADNACRLACIQALRRAVKSGIVVIDSAGNVLEKYRRHLDGRGQPGVGDAFFKHVVDHQFNRKRVRRIEIARHAERGFEGFPAGAALATFDPSDRVYVTLALIASERPLILNAVDSDYSEHSAALDEVGACVYELCPQCIRRRRSG